MTTNGILPTNATCCDGLSNAGINATFGVACCDGAEDAYLPTQVNDAVLGLIAFSLVITLICLMAVVYANLRGKREELALQAQEEENVISQESKEERTRKRKELVSKGLIIKEWVESTKGDQDNPPSGAMVAVPKSLSQPTKPFSPASCAMGGDDYDSLAGEEEKAACAICLSPFKSQQLVCESNNSLCRHIFHKDCMVDWLMKNHDDCPMCREVYLIKTV
jgi:hypothetical protein